MVKGAIFDLDGTILNSMFIWDTLSDEYLKTFGIKPKENHAEIFKTYTLEQSAEYYRSHYGVAYSVSKIVDDLNKMINEFYQTKVNLKSGVKDFLKRLHKKGVKMCVATVTDKTVAKNVLKRLNVLEYFSDIITCADIGCNKENPEIYRLALKHLGTKKSETVVFEDVLHALLTAKNDGFKVVAVYDAHETKQEKMKEYADYYISDFKSFCFPVKMKTALTIAGSDSSGGAGIQADIKTMTMNGIYAMSVITSLTAQNTLGVKSISDSTPEFLKSQLDSVFEDIFPDSVKIGMVSSNELIDVIAERLFYYNAKNIVIDPVMISTSGYQLTKSTAIKTSFSKLLPLATVVTPNIHEAEILSGMKISNKKDILNVAKHISESYGCSVLLKGGHSINDADDLLCENGNFVWFKEKRIDNPNAHGTGCTLSSAIASNLAKGFSLYESVKRAKAYVSRSLKANLDLGKGSGPLMHNFDLKSKYTKENYF